MCGICGFVGQSNPAALERMTSALAHRGPDDAGYFADAEVSLGHRRLSIIDVARGHQPVFNEDRSVVIVFNGEIYNHDRLRQALLKQGHTYATQSDTETIVHAYETYGPACVDHLDGMFAFVLYDQRKKILFGARDRLGKKPFYYKLSPNGSGAEQLRFAFASEPKSLFSHPALAGRPQVSQAGLISYLLNDYVVGGESIYEGISRLEPGSAFTLGLPGAESEGFHCWRYWDIQFRGETSPPLVGDEEAIEQIRRLLSSAIECRLMSEVPLGVFLSGGIDSSSIVALMARLRPAKEIKTFSIGFDEQSFDEAPYAEAMARHYGTEHHVRHFTAAECLTRIPLVASKLDEPFADPSILPVSMLCEFARETVTVALGGDGGDELFAGYAPFKAVGPGKQYHRWVSRSLHRGMQAIAERMLPASDANMALHFKVTRFLRGAAEPSSYRTAAWMGPFHLGQLRRLIPDFAEHLSPREAYAPIIQAHDRLDEVGATDLQQSLDFFERFYLPDDILVKVDRASMMHSLEVRAPYLDTELVEYVNQLPDRMKLRNGVTKYILKQALLKSTNGQPLVPRETVHRAKKGFGIPVARWIRTDLKSAFQTELIDEWPESLAMFDGKVIRQLFEDHVSMRNNHYKELWALFMLAKWARNYLETNAFASASA